MLCRADTNAIRIVIAAAGSAVTNAVLDKVQQHGAIVLGNIHTAAVACGNKAGALQHTDALAQRSTAYVQHFSQIVFGGELFPGFDIVFRNVVQNTVVNGLSDASGAFGIGVFGYFILISYP